MSLCADTLFYNANIYNTPFKTFFKGYFSLKGDKFLHLGQGNPPEDIEFREKIDLGGSWVIPGLIDSHMHIESSMITPRNFAKLMAKNGVTTVVSEPHEIANVKGLEGILAMISAAKGVVMDIFYAIPSSVPSTSREFETTGAEIDLAQLKELLKHREVICLGEVMNTVKILSDPSDKQNRFIDYLKENRPGMPLEGHCPRIMGSDLNQYVYTGIGSDHTEHDVDGFLRRIFNGMIFQIQDKMVKPEIISALKEYSLYENVAFVTDDTNIATLINKGHLNAVIMKAVGNGLDFEKAIYCATAVPARRMRLYDRGRISPGVLADFRILDTLEAINPVFTYKSGKMVYSRAEGLKFTEEKAFPEDFYHTMKVPPVSEDVFRIRTPVKNGKVIVNGLAVKRDTTRTERIRRELPAQDWQLQLDGKTCKITVIERHGKNKNVFSAIATGDCLVKGAVATSYAHDHHNLLVLGDNDGDMALAANTVIKNSGGLAVVKNGKVLARATLEVCGLMSEKDPFELSQDVENVENAMRRIGYVHYNPIMSLATTCLPVSRDVKITDKGLVDVAKGEFIDLFEDFDEGDKDNS